MAPSTVFLLCCGRRSSLLCGRRPSLLCKRRPSLLCERRPSLLWEWRPSLLWERRPSLLWERQTSFAAMGETSFAAMGKTDVLRCYGRDRRSSLLWERRSSLLWERRSSLLWERRSSLLWERQKFFAAMGKTDVLCCYGKDRRPLLLWERQTFFPAMRKTCFSAMLCCAHSRFDRSWGVCKRDSLTNLYILFLSRHRHVGLVVKASASKATDSGFDSRLIRDFSRSSHTIDLKKKLALQWIPCQAPGVCMISAGTGWPGVCILCLVEIESLICHVCLSVVARTLTWADPSLRYTSMLLGR